MILRIRLPTQALAILLCATAASAQENRGTAEQRAACAPDAFRFCVGYMPDPVRVEFCLRQNMSDLSDACHAVFEQSTSVWASKKPGGNETGRPTRPATTREAE
jgi:hypothetical protein